MHNEPLNIYNNVKLFLDFKSDGYGRMQINEDVGFDTLNLQLEQGKDRYARDFLFSLNDLTIHKKTNLEAFEKISEYIEIYGFESEIDYIIHENGIDYESGTADIDLSKSDLLTKVVFSLSEETNRTLIKRKGKTKINVFSDEDLDGNSIEPIQTYNILLKAKPTQVSSTWGLIPNYYEYTGADFIGNVTYQNPIKDGTIQNIQSSLSWFPNSAIANNLTLTSNQQDFRIVNAQNDLTNNVIRFEGIVIKYLIPTGEPFLDTPTVAVNWISGLNRIQFRYYTGTSPAPDFYTEGLFLDYEYEFVRTINVDGLYPDLPVSLTGDYDEYTVTITDQEFEINTIPRDNGLWGIFNLGRRLTITDWVSGEVKITSTSTGIDSIIKGSRYIDGIKQVVKSINGNDVVAPRFDVGGEFYDNFIANGNLIRGIVNEPFPIDFNELMEQLPEFNADYQANDENIEIDQYPDFYKDVEIFSYKLPPNETFEESFNERFKLGTFELEYDIYETDKDEQNTKDSVHTKTQWDLPNKRAKEDLSIKLPFFRDPNKFEFLRAKNEITDGTTALSDDNNIGILDVVPLAPGTKRTINAIMTHRVDEGVLKLLNDGTFNWEIRGFNVGDAFEILKGFNVGEYTVTEFNTTVISLEGISPTPTPTEEGETFTKVEYTITNTSLTNRTNEGFDLIEGIDNPNNYSNLLYTPKRNIKYWESFLNTSLRYKPNGVIKNTFFVNNPELKTQFGGGDIITETADINKVDLQEPILSPKLLKTTLLVNFAEHDQIIKGIINDKGYVRVVDTLDRMRKIYPRKTDYTWSKNELEIPEGEVKQESEYLEVTKTGEIIKIDRVDYNSELVYPIEYKAEGDYLQLFDTRGVALSNKRRYDFVKVNDVQYDNIDDLVIALSEL